jgi:hypothetical protein
MTMLANEASTNVDTAQTLQMCINTILNHFIIILQTGSLFAIFGDFLSTLILLSFENDLA